MMRLRQLFHLPIVLLCLTSCAQEEKTKPALNIQRYTYRLGTTEITVQKTTADTAGNWFFTQLHDNEETAKTAAMAFLQQHGGTFVSIENGGKRLISFTLNGKTHRFDPNRMFTTNGIRQNLKLYNGYTAAAATEISRFRDSLLRLLPDTALVIAVHNNTEALYSIESYTHNKLFRREAAALHINKNRDADDFFITTNHGLFKKLAGQHYNAVLQSSRTPADDGSLSVYCSRRRQPYINIEAQAGHLEEQQKMLAVLKEMLPE